MPHTPDGYYSSWAQFSIIPKDQNRRKDIMLKLNEKNTNNDLLSKMRTSSKSI